MSPDWADKPEAVPYSSLDNPQSLNLYGYVNNNPLSKVDADGHCPECITAEGFFGAEVGSVLGPVGAVVGAGVAILAGTHPDAIADIISNGRPPSYVPGGSLTDENGNSIFMSNKSGATNAPSQSPSGPSDSASPIGPSGNNQGGNKRTDIVQADERAQGDHSVAKRDANGKVTGYTTFDKNGNRQAVMRPDGKPHGGVNPPLVKEPAPGKGPGSPANRARPARPEEIPQ
jgi:hypothetical protein